MSDTAPSLPQRHTTSRRTGLVAALVAVLLVAVGATAFAINRGGDGDTRTVRIGTTEAAADYWPVLKQKAKDEGIDLDVVNFSDYSQPNPAVAQGQVDVNLFQHLLYLASYNVADNQNLVPVAATVVVPLSLYSKKHDTVEDIPDGGTIAIPNDPTNGARALLVLQQAGLVTLKDGGSPSSTPADVDKATSRVKVKAVDAAQTAASLPSVDGAIVNNNFASDAGLDPNSAIFKDDPRAKEAAPYVNAFVTTQDKADDADIATVIRLYKSPEVQKAVVDQSGGTAVPVDRTQAQLTKVLEGLEKDLKEGK